MSEDILFIKSSPLCLLRVLRPIYICFTCEDIRMYVCIYIYMYEEVFRIINFKKTWDKGFLQGSPLESKVVKS